MFFFDEDVEIDSVDLPTKSDDGEDVFDNLESVVENEEENKGGEQ